MTIAQESPNEIYQHMPQEMWICFHWCHQVWNGFGMGSSKIPMAYFLYFYLPYID